MSTAAEPGRSASGANLTQAGQVPVRYIGLITRGIAFAVDGAIINAVAIVVGLGAELILSLLPYSKTLKTILIPCGAVVYVLWTVGYFVVFWSTTGQTPGNRTMGFRVAAITGERIKPRRALVRYAGLVIAAVPLFAGYLPILFSPRRRGLPDFLARTVVVEAIGPSRAQLRRAAKRERAEETSLERAEASDDPPVRSVDQALDAPAPLPDKIAGSNGSVATSTVDRSKGTD
jgi:uncharacterized RDD family membrane protein YckC